MPPTVAFKQHFVLPKLDVSSVRTIFYPTLNECGANKTLNPKLGVSVLNNFLMVPSPTRVLKAFYL
jgi:hypothetical protein